MGAQQSAGAVYRRLLRYVYPYWGSFSLALLGMVAVAATEPMFAWLMKPMLDGSFVHKDPQAIHLVPLAILGIFMVRGISGFVSTYCMAMVGRNVIGDLRAQLFGHLLKLPTRFYDTHSTGQLTSKMIYDVEQVARALGAVVTVVVRDSFTILGLMAFMFYLNWMLSMVFIVLAPVITVLVVYISRRFRRISHRIQTSMGDVTQISQEVIEGHRVIKIFCGEATETKNFAVANDYNRNQNMKLAATGAAALPVSQFLGALALSVIVYAATQPSTLESVTPGTFMSFMTAAMLLLAPMKRLSSVNVNLQQGIAASQAIFHLLDQDVERDNGQVSLDRAQGALVFDNVSFAYDADKGPVLREISFTVEPGQTIAFVGRSGSGKSTLVSLIPRFYEIDSGAIFLDGQPLSDIKLADLRKQIALVSQDITLFNDTIGNNIRYGSDAHASRDEIERAATQAHAMEFISQLPAGLDTEVGDKGVLLSGGQRQRVAIARALLKDAPILILDEATSALDTESERHIQDALEILMRGRTTLVIAHRLSTIEKADKIIVMQDGRIVESGRHQELLARGGQYATLHKMQFRDAG